VRLARRKAIGELRVRHRANVRPLHRRVELKDHRRSRHEPGFPAGVVFGGSLTPQVVGFICASEDQMEDAMRQDLLVISGGMLAVGIVVWAFWGNPPNVPRMHTGQEMKADPRT
jgi:hypothetical protein